MKYVQINEIIFTGRQNIKWTEVENYLKRYVGKTFIVGKYGDELHVNALFANEYAESQYTKKLKAIW
ncbi:MAG: hypothetical protein NC413_15945 [Muribaculum sp.]|nr:hypothetical protein [Muribaculum sp.]